MPGSINNKEVDIKFSANEAFLNNLHQVHNAMLLKKIKRVWFLVWEFIIQYRVQTFYLELELLNTFIG